MVVEGFITMIDDISSVAHQALVSGGGGGALLPSIIIPIPIFMVLAAIR